LLQSGFVTRSLYPALLVVVCSVGCGRLPETFAPPPQKAALSEAPAGGPGYFFSMADANVDTYLVQGVADRGPGTWRWAFEHPVLRFFLPESKRLQFTMDFTLPESTFRDTGPVTLSISMNGKPLDQVHCESAGQQSYTHVVPADSLRGNAINLVAIDTHPIWISHSDNQRLGFILLRAGFTE
jgi:hypothetical protein